MAPRKPSTRRKKVAAASLGLAAPETATVESADLKALSAAIAGDGGVVLAQYRDPVGGKPLILACLPVDRVEPTPYQRDASDTHVKRLMGVVEKIGLFLDPIALTQHVDALAVDGARMKEHLLAGGIPNKAESFVCSQCLDGSCHSLIRSCSDLREVSCRCSARPEKR